MQGQAETLQNPVPYPSNSCRKNLHTHMETAAVSVLKSHVEGWGGSPMVTVLLIALPIAFRTTALCPLSCRSIHISQHLAP